MGYLGANFNSASNVLACEEVLRDLKTVLVADPTQRELYRMRTAKRLLREVEAKAQIFDPRGHLFGDPGWNIMLAIRVLGAERGKVTVTDASNASYAPPTTGLRYLTALIAAGYVRREQDWMDRRKSFVSLTELGAALMDEFLDETASL